MSNKILALEDQIVVGWLDHVADVRLRTFDRKEERWGETLLLGRGVDNHSGPALTRDSQGYLYAIFGPHGRDPFQLRRSLRPDDASEWTEVEQVGARATYPSLVCGPDDTLHLAYRGNPMPARLMYQRRPAGGAWSAPRALVDAQAPSGYTQYGNALAISPDGTLHLAFHVYDVHPKAGKAAGYLRSRDGGTRWETAAGVEVELPATPATECFVEQGPELDMRVTNLAVDPEGRPYLFVLHLETDPASAKLWTLEGEEWRGVELLPWVQSAFPSHRIGQSGSLTCDARGRLYIAVEIQEPPGGWGHESGTVVLLTSDDRGRSFELLRVSPQDSDGPCWLPSLERPYGPEPLTGLPSLLYTRGGPGEGTTGGDPTEIVFVRFGPERRTP